MDKVFLEWVSFNDELPPDKPVLMCWRPIDHKERPQHRELVIGQMAHESETKVWVNGRYYDIKTHVTEWALVELPIK